MRDKSRHLSLLGNTKDYISSKEREKEPWARPLPYLSFNITCNPSPAPTVSSLVPDMGICHVVLFLQKWANASFPLFCLIVRQASDAMPKPLLLGLFLRRAIRADAAPAHCKGEA